MRSWNWKDTLGVLAIVLAGALLVVGGVMTSGCSALETGCTKALPTLQQVDVRVADVQTWVAQAQVLVDAIPNEATRTLAQGYLDKVLATLRGVESLASDAVSACTAPDLVSLFADVVKAVLDVQRVISLYGGPTTPWLAPPLVVVEAHAR